MHTEPNQMKPARARMHPLAMIASISVVVLSAVGISALLYNRSEAQGAPQTRMAQATAVAPGDTVAPPPPGYDNTAPASPQAAPAPVAPVAPAPPGPRAVPYPPPPAPQGYQPAPPAPPFAQGPPPCPDCVIVEAIRPIQVRAPSTGLGAVGGGIAGGLIGNSIGNGRGNVAATVLGAVGGALAGNAIEQNARTRTEYQLMVRYPSGRTRFFTHQSPWPYRVGDTVRIVHGRVVTFQ